MSAVVEPKKISDLEIGPFAGEIVVRVDRIIRVQHLCHPHEPHRPMIEQGGVQVVVFDDSVRGFNFFFFLRVYISVI